MGAASIVYVYIANSCVGTRCGVFGGSMYVQGLMSKHSLEQIECSFSTTCNCRAGSEATNRGIVGQISKSMTAI